MRTNSQAPLQFVKSSLVAANYPAASINGQDHELYGIMQFVENMFPKLAILVCQRSETPSVQYVNSNFKKLLGYEPAEIKKMSLPDFLKLVHPEDIQDVHQCFAFINASEPYDPLLYRFELNYRIKHKRGHYINITDEKLAMQYRCGEYIYINCFKDVTDEAMFHHVNMNIYQLMQGTFKKVQTFIPRQGQDNFTPRQKDIVNLVAKGFTNQQIAERLSVSVNTIKNHKSMLFRKVKVKNSIGLLSVTRDSYNLFQTSFANCSNDGSLAPINSNTQLLVK
jgi:PAS domain S-box-containing protein